MEIAKNQIKDYLLTSKISFEEFYHDSVGDPIAYSEQNGTRLEQQAKALLLRCKKSGGDKFFIIVSVPASKKVDFNVISLKLGGNIKSVRVADKEQLFELTGCIPGELPPLGKLWGIPVMFDMELFNENKIFFNAGSLEYSIIADPHDIAKIEDAILI